MAGTFMIRRERDGYFYARPLFVCPGMGYNDPKPVGKGHSYLLAFEDLRWRMPEQIRDRMAGIDRWDFYSAPERIDDRDMCVDLDRHHPNVEERINRRVRFLDHVKLGHVQSTWNLELLKKEI